MIPASYRDWMMGSNNPIDPTAKLNSNAKIHSKWAREYACLRQRLETNKMEADAKAMAKQRKEADDAALLLSNFRSQKRDYRVQRAQKRKKKNEVRQMETTWVTQKMAANEAWVRSEAERVLKEEVSNEQQRMERALAVQCRYDRKWANQRAGLLASTKHYASKSVPSDHSERAHRARDLPGEVEWRALQCRTRPETTHSVKQFRKTAPVLSPTPPPLSAPLVPRGHSARFTTSPLPWTPQNWRPQNPLDEGRLRMPVATQYDHDKVIKVGNGLIRSRCESRSPP